MSLPPGKKIVYRWDLDKTYLRTEFDSLRDLWRTAFEAPNYKETMPAATVLVRELQRTSAAGFHILSGSPELMRKPLEAKLRLDGIEWDSLTLKPSVQNLLRGRFRFLKDQVAYKLGALLRSRLKIGNAYNEILFGDDAEADAFVYSLYGDILADRVPLSTLRVIFERAKLYPTHAEELMALVSTLRDRKHTPSSRDQESTGVVMIFINLERMSAPRMFSEFGGRVCPCFNYFETALVLLDLGYIDLHQALSVAASLATHPSSSPDALLASYRDLARRGRIGRETFELLRGAGAQLSLERYGRAHGDLEAFIAHLGLESPPPQVALSIRPIPIDYFALYERDRQRAKAAKRRAKFNRF